MWLSHPNLPSCADCCKYVYDKNWKPVYQRGSSTERELRPQSPLGAVVTPCWSCPKIPGGVEPKPENSEELSEKNQLAYWYYLQCKEDTTGILPRDRIVIRNNALIAMVERHEATGRQQTILPLVLTKQK